jgi:hypothetical protein
MIPGTDTAPIPIRTDETGAEYIPLHPAPGMRSVAIGAGDAVVLWSANVRTARRAAALGQPGVWAAATSAAEFYLSVAIDLNPMMDCLREHRPLSHAEGEA